MSDRFVRIDQTAVDAMATRLASEHLYAEMYPAWAAQDLAMKLLDAAYRAQTDTERFGAGLEDEFKRLDEEQRGKDAD